MPNASGMRRRSDRSGATGPALRRYRRDHDLLGRPARRGPVIDLCDGRRLFSTHRLVSTVVDGITRNGFNRDCRRMRPCYMSNDQHDATKRDRFVDIAETAPSIGRAGWWGGGGGGPVTDSGRVRPVDIAETSRRARPAAGKSRAGASEPDGGKTG